MDALESTREALRLRQGSGARYDASNAPAQTLAWARSGTAYFARLLNDLSDGELDEPSLLPKVDRRHIVAEVGYHARALTRVTEASACGAQRPVCATPAERRKEIEDGATLPARALRGLFRHAAVHLDVEWRDLDEAAWDARPTLANEAECPVRETPWLRARTLWLRAVDLDVGGSFRDMPRPLVNRLIQEVGEAWVGGAVTLAPSDRAAAVALGGGGGLRIAGTTADLAHWLTGRGARRLTHEGPLPPVPVFHSPISLQSENA